MSRQAALLDPATPPSADSAEGDAATVPLPWYTMLMNPETGLVLEIANANTLAGAQLVANKPTGALSQRWQLSSGRLISLLNGLQLFIPGSSPQPGTQVISMLVPPIPGSPYAKWAFTSSGQLQNPSSGLVLDVSGTAAGSAVVANTASQSATQRWTPFPSFDLTLILQDSNKKYTAPYPPFTGDELTAYNQLSSMVGLVGQGIRDVYDDLTKDLSSLKTDVQNATCPSSIPQDAWDAVVKQLSYELGMAADVQQLYDVLLDWYSDRFSISSHLLESLIQEAGVQETTLFQSTPFVLFVGTLYTVLSMAGTPAGAVANLMVTAINTASAAMPLNQQFQIAVSDLYSQLGSSFEAINEAMDTNFTAIVKDYGKLQAVVALINTAGPGSLSLSMGDRSQWMKATTRAWRVEVLRQLLPIHFSIYQWSQTGNPSGVAKGLLGDVPSYAQWAQPLGNGLYNLYVIAAGRGQFPSEKVLKEHLWDVEVSQQEFFTNRATWPFKVTEWNLRDGNSLETIITNQTGVDMVVTASIPDGQGAVWGKATQTLPAWAGQVRYISVYRDGDKVLYTLTPVGSKTAVASFVAHQKYAVAIGASPWVDGQQATPPYSWSQPACTDSVLGQGGSPGIIQMSLGPLALTQG